MKLRKILSLMMVFVFLLGCSVFTNTVYAGTANKNDEPIVGAPTQKTWNFEADKSGTYQIVFTYARPWNKSDVETKTVTYTIKVSEEKNTDSTIIALVADKENVVKLGQKFTVTLEENASTGYEWTYTIKDNGITLISTDTEPLVGASENKQWTFKAGKIGTYKLVFTLARPWKKNNSDSKIVVYKIKVTNKNAKTSDSIGLVEGKINTICKNQKFFIILEENASTGFSWSYKTSAKTVKMVEEKNLDKVGEPAKMMWTFAANKSGTYKIVFSYARPWENDSSDSKVVEYTIKVLDEKNTDESSLALTEGKENIVKLGQTFFVSLEENASTGYLWNYDIDGNVISLVE
jgi:inhibitor of cysteine peptidase